VITFCRLSGEPLQLRRGAHLCNTRTSPMSIKIPDGNAKLKRAYEPPAADDGTRILIDCLGCARFWPTISAIVRRRLIVTAPQTLVRSLLDCTYPVVLADRSGAADSQIDAGCARLRRARSMVSDSHYIVAQQRFLVLNFLQKHLERISCIEHSHRP
jgi:hypothetical protein